MDYLIYKALHIFGFITWFASLFYLGRLFVYHREALDHSSPVKETLHNQYCIMEKRLYYMIGHSAMLITLVFGILMLFQFPFKSAYWLHTKLLFIIILLIYHFYCGYIIRTLRNEKKKFSSSFLRIFNEATTSLLIVIVFLAVIKEVKTALTYAMVLICLIFILLIIFIFKKKKGLN